jgi:hypothetical protein
MTCLRLPNAVLLFSLALQGCATDRYDLVPVSAKPIEFLALLQKNVGTGSAITVSQPVRGWITEQDVPGLLARLDSAEPCLPVVRSESSYLPATSTVGAEAAFLLNGFIRDEYPPALYSSSPGLKSKEELVEWWKQRQSGSAE